MQISNLNKEKRERGLTLSLILIILIITIFSLISLLTNVELTNSQPLSQNPYYYDLELYYNKGNIEINSVEIEFSQEEKSNFNKDNSYYLEITDGEKRILNKVFFSIPNFVIYDFVDEQGNFIATNESGLKTLENVSFNVFAPYYKNGYEVGIYNKNGKELDRGFVSQFSKIGFNKKDFLEKSIENEIVGIDSQREEKEIDGKKTNTLNYYFDYKNYIILLIIILIIVLIYFLSRKK